MVRTENLGYEVAIGSIQECVTAAAGRVVRDIGLWQVMEGRILVEARARGPALVLDEALGFWGGLDPATGKIVEANHPQRGSVVRARYSSCPRDGALFQRDRARRSYPSGHRAGGIVLGEPDHIVAIGASWPRSSTTCTCRPCWLLPGSLAAVRDGDEVLVA